MPEFSRLDIQAIVENPGSADTVVASVLRVLRETAGNTLDSAALEGVKTSIRCDAIYNSERLHYYGFMIASQLMAGGWEFVANYPALVDSVTLESALTAADRWLVDPRYVVTVVTPADSEQVAYVPHGLNAEQVGSYFDTATIAEHGPDEGKDLTYPAVDSVVLTWSDPSIYHREVLENGLTVLVKSGPGSQVFAMNVLARNRTSSEPDGQAGITDFMHRCLEKGTTSRDAETLARDLAAIGAQVTLYDNPWIPYDDMYTTRSYSFAKFETIEDYAEQGFELLTDMINYPAFDSAQVENVRSEMLALFGRKATSPREVAGNLFMATLFKDRPFARPIMGTEHSITFITADDLHRYHERYFAPDNLILSVVTNRDTAEVMGWVRNAFGNLEASGEQVTGPTDTELILATREVFEPLESEQAAIYAGGRLPGAGSDEVVDLQVATAILSDRLFKNLRERQGLAYSTGASAIFDRQVGWYRLYLATAGENYRKAVDGMVLQTEKLSFDGPLGEEVRRAANEIWGRLMRIKTARINQAFYLGVNDFLGRPLPYDGELLEKLGASSLQSVRRVSSKYFRPARWVVAGAGGSAP
jgi:zinc protease